MPLWSGICLFGSNSFLGLAGAATSSSSALLPSASSPPPPSGSACLTKRSSTSNFCASGCVLEGPTGQSATMCQGPCCTDSSRIVRCFSAISSAHRPPGCNVRAASRNTRSSKSERAMPPPRAFVLGQFIKSHTKAAATPSCTSVNLELSASKVRTPELSRPSRPKPCWQSSALSSPEARATSRGPSALGHNRAVATNNAPRLQKGSTMGPSFTSCLAMGSTTIHAMAPGSWLLASRLATSSHGRRAPGDVDLCCTFSGTSTPKMKWSSPKNIWTSTSAFLLTNVKPAMLSTPRCTASLTAELLALASGSVAWTTVVKRSGSVSQLLLPRSRSAAASAAFKCRLAAFAT
mmetsp:Transcript_104394/g.264931  ORF Transcript_104394/g.264931 Transcript_104394/m.264931 type:complete len:349 (-) Transcript_104394:674-1720(-)